MQRPLAVSRVMQVFRDQAVRERLLREDESLVYLQRKHFKTAKTGFTTAGEAEAKERKPMASIYARMAEGLDLA